jgi:hypothetical protein
VKSSDLLEQRINSIFGDLDVFHSSKRNQFRISRGMQGDALKEVLCIPYVLAAKYQSYFNKPWDEPLIIRNGFGCLRPFANLKPCWDVLFAGSTIVNYGN